MQNLYIVQEKKQITFLALGSGISRGIESYPWIANTYKYKRVLKESTL